MTSESRADMCSNEGRKREGSILLKHSWTLKTQSSLWVGKDLAVIKQCVCVKQKETETQSGRLESVGLWSRCTAEISYCVFTSLA